MPQQSGAGAEAEAGWADTPSIAGRSSEGRAVTVPPRLAVQFRRRHLGFPWAGWRELANGHLILRNDKTITFLSAAPSIAESAFGFIQSAPMVWNSLGKAGGNGFPDSGRLWRRDRPGRVPAAAGAQGGGMGRGRRNPAGSRRDRHRGGGAVGRAQLSSRPDAQPAVRRPGRCRSRPPGGALGTGTGRNGPVGRRPARPPAMPWPGRRCFVTVFATHALLDAFTGYGTQLWLPFSNQRVAWHGLSIIDPLFTVPLLLALLAGAAGGWRRRRSVVAAICRAGAR